MFEGVVVLYSGYDRDAMREIAMDGWRLFDNVNFIFLMERKIYLSFFKMQFAIFIPNHLSHANVSEY